MQYIVTFDSNGNPLEGVRNYKLSLPSGIPANDFWSVIVYDCQTRFIVHTDQKWPSVFSNSKALLINEDGSVEVWFGPKPPSEKNSNWIMTIPGKRWFMILRLYSPMQAWFDKTWKPGEIEEVRQLVEI